MGIHEYLTLIFRRIAKSSSSLANPVYRNLAQYFQDLGKIWLSILNRFERYFLQDFLADVRQDLSPILHLKVISTMLALPILARSKIYSSLSVNFQFYIYNNLFLDMLKCFRVHLCIDCVEVISTNQF